MSESTAILRILQRHVGSENAISAYTERWLLILGLIYVVVTLFAPAGLLGLLRARQATVRM